MRPANEVLDAEKRRRTRTRFVNLRSVYRESDPRLFRSILADIMVIIARKYFSTTLFAWPALQRSAVPSTRGSRACRGQGVASASAGTAEGFGEAKPPRDLSFPAGCGGKAAAASGKTKELGGHSPSKPPLRTPTA